MTARANMAGLASAGMNTRQNDNARPVHYYAALAAFGRQSGKQRPFKRSQGKGKKNKEKSII
jgi:hypothetical protein